MIYFIQQGNTGPIKVGHTIDPRTRLADLKVGSSERLQLLALIPGGQRLERVLHSELEQHKLEGEWYDISRATALRIIKRSVLGEFRKLEGERERARELTEQQRQLIALGKPQQIDFAAIREVFAGRPKAFSREIAQRLGISARTLGLWFR